MNLDFSALTATSSQMWGEAACSEQYQRLDMEDDEMLEDAPFWDIDEDDEEFDGG